MWEARQNFQFMPKDGSQQSKSCRVDGSGDKKSLNCFLWKHTWHKNISWVDLKPSSSGEQDISKQLVGLIAFAWGEQEHVLQVVDAGVVEEHVGKHLEGDEKLVRAQKIGPLEPPEQDFHFDDLVSTESRERE